MASNWQDRAAEKRTRIQASIPKEWLVQSPASNTSAAELIASSDLLTPQEVEITRSAATDLVKKLSTGDLTSVEVTLAFCKRAALVHQATKCIHEFFPEAALAQAKELDAYFAEKKKTVGPLHGLPISLKDQLRVKGHETHMGYVGWLGKYDSEDSVLTHLLRKAGAVFYVKTSVPQTLMVCETINNVIGRTVNPRNPLWSCGGSSGGEGAMVGARGGIIGVGTDIAGSIRVPSAFNFLYGIRPSHGRLPYAKMANSMEGQETVHSVVGPLAHSASDLRLFLTSVLAEQPWQYDSKVIPMPWRTSEEEVIQTKLRSGGLTVGYYRSDGNVLPHPPVLRAVDKVLELLKDNGNSVVPWTPYKHDYAVDLINQIFAADGCADTIRELEASGEPAIPNIKDLLNPDIKAIDMNALWDANLKKWNYQMEYLEEWRKLEESMGKELDAIIAPITPTAAVLHNKFRYYGYASVVNLLDLTSVVVPVTFADKNVDATLEDYSALNEEDARVQSEYDAAAYHGAPVGIQVIGRRLSEERTLAIAEEIGRLLGNAPTL